MQPPKKNAWKEYVGYLWVSFFISIGSGVVFWDKGPWWVTLTVVAFSAILFATMFFTINFYLPRARFRSFWLTCLARTLIITGVLIVGLVVIVPVAIGLSARLSPFDSRVIETFTKFATEEAPTWIGYGILLSFAINAFFQVDRKLGPGAIVKWLTGKYYHPREEERIFMFLDLKNSTTLAEKLGNLRFSRLCQEFFRDLSLPVEGTKGEVSHYIGDEAVLCWKPKNGLEKANCLLCFFYMQGAIDKRRDYYLREFGIVPEFKAGVHIGDVVAAEVGEIKSEIVYHGDVLNTTARITGLCAQLNSDLLMSGDLFCRIEIPAELFSEPKGHHLLKGKEHEVEVVAVSLNADRTTASTAANELTHASH